MSKGNPIHTHKFPFIIIAAIAIVLLGFIWRPVAAATQEVVFDGQFAPGWEDWSWQVKLDGNNVDAKAWGGVYFRYIADPNGIEVASLEGLSIDIDTDIAVQVGVVADYDQKMIPVAGDRTLSIEELTHAGVERIYGIMIQSTFVDHKYTLNNVSLITKGLPPPPPTTAPTEIPPTEIPPTTVPPTTVPTEIPPTTVPPTTVPTTVPPTAVPTVEIRCGGLSQEAETGELYGDFSIVSDSNASGNRAVRSSNTGENPALSNAHRAEFCVTIPEDGDYVILARTLATSGAFNSMYVQVDQAPAGGFVWHMKPSNSYTSQYVSDGGSYNGNNPPVTIRLTKGDHMVAFFNREKNVRLDKFELIKVVPTPLPPTIVPTEPPPTVQPTEPPPTEVPPTTVPTACGGLSQEAETGDVFGLIEVTSDDRASGNRAVVASAGYDGDVLSNDHRVDFCVTVEKAGNYHIVGRVLAATSGSNSMFVTVDGSPSGGMTWHMSTASGYADVAVSDGGSPNGGNPAASIYLAKGNHMISFFHRETNVRLDKFSVVAEGSLPTVTPEPSPTVTQEPPPTVTPVTPVPTQIPSGGKAYYVSRNGNNSNGRSWANAWNELNKINWGTLRPGDVVYIDGGSHSMTYRTTLKPTRSGQSGKPITLQLSRENGRNGQAIFFGGNSVPLPECGVKSWNDSQHRNAGDHGIEFMNSVSNITVDGTKRHGIVIHGWKSSGIQFDRHSTTRNITLRYMEIYNNGGTRTENDGGVRVINPSHSDSGIEFGGVGHKFHFLEIHDNSGDAIQSGSSPNNMDDFTLTDSWLYNQRPHSGKDNSPSSDVCTASNRSGCDEYGAPQMGPDYWNYPNPPRRESFNWCTHSDGIQIFTGNDFNTMRIERSIIGPNFMTGLLLGDRNSSSTTAWVNNLTMRDVVITRFMHNGMGMKNPPSNAGRNWDIQNVTIYGHQNNKNKVSLHADWTGGPNHQVRKTIVVNGHVKFPHGHVSFSNNCQWKLYSGSVNGANTDPQFQRIMSGDVFEANLNVDFATVFRDDYTVRNSRCSQAGSRLTTAAELR